MRVEREGRPSGRHTGGGPGRPLGKRRGIAQQVRSWGFPPTGRLYNPRRGQVGDPPAVGREQPASGALGARDGRCLLAVDRADIAQVTGALPAADEDRAPSASTTGRCRPPRESTVEREGAELESSRPGGRSRKRVLGRTGVSYCSAGTAGQESRRRHRAQDVRVAPARAARRPRRHHGAAQAAGARRVAGARAGRSPHRPQFVCHIVRGVGPVVRRPSRDTAARAGQLRWRQRLQRREGRGSCSRIAPIRLAALVPQTPACP